MRSLLHQIDEKEDLLLDLIASNNQLLAQARSGKVKDVELARIVPVPVVERLECCEGSQSCSEERRRELPASTPKGLR